MRLQGDDDGEANDNRQEHHVTPHDDGGLNASGHVQLS